MNLLKKIIIFGYFVAVLAPIRANAKDVVVVIDPGHGGENLGGHTEQFVEQELTILVAKHMKERLSLYDNVKVYLTHEEIGEKDLSRTERAEIAAKYNADFIFSLHFNMSENHNLYGAEVWTSAFGSYYAKGQEFATILMDGMVNELGFFDRGVKVRIGKTGDDYYGIILNGKNQKIPTVIIEHCHMDEERDYSFLLNNENPYQTLGYMDADAVAKYFRLSSSTLGVDYSDYERKIFETPNAKVLPDTSEPEYCDIKLIDFDEKELKANIEISANDSDGILQYYSVSYDGINYERLRPWSDSEEAKEPEEKNIIRGEVKLIPGQESRVKVRTYNRYDLYTESEFITLPAGELKEVKEQESISEYREITYEVTKQELLEENKTLTIIVISALITGAIFLTAVLVVYSVRNSRRRRKRRRK